MKMITIVTGHYGSGKTEFSLNLALKLAKQGNKTALIDLDIANVYFRSRERQQLLEDNGVEVHSNAYHYDITADLPALSPTIRKPLENLSYRTVIDVGGDHSGARILNQFNKYFSNDQSEMLCVINANRPETDTVEGALRHIFEIEEETKIKINGLINNTHLLKETKIEDILKGYDLCNTISKKIKIPIVYNCCVEGLCNQLKEENKYHLNNFTIFPIRLYMRPSYLDR